MIIKLLILILFLLITSPAYAGLTLIDSGSGINRVVTIESSGQFRLAFEAAMNYGLSKWYDLVNDPTASLNILANPTNYLPVHAQNAIFNQCIAQGDVIGHVISASLDWPDVARSLTIIENGPLRVIVENSYSPMLDGSVNTNIVFTDRYWIYHSGQIYISHKLHSLTTQSVGEWRNSVIGLGDPFYLGSGDTMSAIADNGVRTLTDSTKSWATNQWANYAVQEGNETWLIVSNTATALTVGAKIGGGGADTLISTTYNIETSEYHGGWIRASASENPWTYGGSQSYIFEYWDPATPAPNTNWTKASVMLVPAPGNPSQGVISTHGWQGFKRFYYGGLDLNLTAGQDIIQYYMIQLGTQGSGILPNINSSTVAGPIASVYLADQTPPTIDITDTSSSYHISGRVVGGRVR